MVSLSLTFCVMISMMFILMDSPIGMGILLFLLSLLLVFCMSLLMSSWFAYMLFLVYIGGLLVMFIYICMISSNFQMSNLLNLWNWGAILIMSSMFLMLDYNQKLIMFNSINMNGMNFPLFLFLSLGIYLLICFLAVIHIILKGGVSLNYES